MMFQVLTKKINNIYERRSENSFQKNKKYLNNGDIELNEKLLDKNEKINLFSDLNIELKVANDPEFRPKFNSQVFK